MRGRSAARVPAWVLILVVTVGGGWVFWNYLPSTPAPVPLLGEFYRSPAFPVLVVIWFVLLAIFLALASYSSPALRTVSRGSATIMILASVLIILFQFFFPGQRVVGMTRTGFTSTYVPIYSHDTVTFQNPADGVTQILCTGLNQQCELSPDTDPPQLRQELVIRPGQSVTIEFDHYGKYSITSKNTPNMNVKIYVQCEGKTSSC